MFKNMKYLYFFTFVFIIASACLDKKKISFQSPQAMTRSKLLLSKTEFCKAVFIDNTELKPNHLAGYNGIAELYHSEQDSTVFVPSYAGFNLEHLFSGDSLVQFFEPRINPMSLYKKNDNEVILFQEEESNTVSGVESLTEFKIVAPCSVDSITFRCLLHKREYFKHDYAGFFWASYINNPPDMKIWFMGVAGGHNVEDWITAFSEKHGSKSTHRYLNDDFNFFSQRTLEQALLITFQITDILFHFILDVSTTWFLRIFLTHLK